ncbi:putative S-adenosyl-L-methionine-dependent methyltransferase [Lupinus albus]|uniref:Putative S-adenosyl-L-methionine-dependent methyltransferase n=1 Tax=Lupinus albus TaxID=3870 RepID=A0A6A4NBT8_LUPAL|nr:putative S-adenosyl-L-methionine-dependent methyltransferase [Lupinus albus]
MEEKSIIHYRSSDRILLVGEGDFSFSLCLARKFGTAKNMGKNIKNVLANLTELKNLGCTILHQMDVHTMSKHQFLPCNYFDVIVFNFPHAGFIYREDDSLQIELHKKLVRGFFSSAKDILWLSGVIHITHKTTSPYSEWKIKELASLEGLFFIGEEKFYPHRYPGYTNKRGNGRLCDITFPIGESSTFVFNKYI